MFEKSSRPQREGIRPAAGAVCSLAVRCAEAEHALRAACIGDVAEHGRYIEDRDVLWIEHATGAEGCDLLLLGNVSGDGAPPPEVVVWTSPEAGAVPTSHADGSGCAAAAARGGLLYVRACGPGSATGCEEPAVP
ncbi:hypothetical protein [Streptomyces specialis]|uniref:hypothetical protein n=1 Tax=Streptomyces specialis TaxID=498367 RepID=UPI00073F433F|nr:hypothetical protein [Streptomyces specialis]